MLTHKLILIDFRNKVDLWKHLINFFNSVTLVSAKLSKGPKVLELTEVSFPDEEFFKGFMPVMTGNDETKGNAKAFLEVWHSFAIDWNSYESVILC